MKNFRRICLVFVVLIIAYTLIMLGVASIPNSAVEKNVNASLNYLENEGVYPKIFFDSLAGRLDNFTDKAMLQGALTNANFKVGTKAMLICGRTQYWQGYLMTLKPLLIKYNILQIRLIMYICFFALFIVSILLVNKKFGRKAAFAYSAAVLSGNVLVDSISLQFAGVFYITFIAVITACIINLEKLSYGAIALYFVVCGSVTCFIDFLTAPLITLGIPLGLIIIGFCMDKEKNIKDVFLLMVDSSVSWAMSYGLTFVAKWGVACLLMKQNVFMSSLKQGLIRFNDEEKIEINRIEMLKSNAGIIFGFELFNWKKLVIFGCVLLILAFVISIFIYKKRFCTKLIFCILLAMYPYAWYIILANHSQIHFWFTYRAQITTIFMATYVFADLIDIKRLLSLFDIKRAKLHNRENKEALK